MRGLAVAGLFGALLAPVGVTARVYGGDSGAYGPDSPRRAALVVAIVRGADRSREIDASDLEDRIAAMPGFQRATFGRTADVIRHNVLSDILVRETLLSISAEALKVEGQPAVAYALDRARSIATVRAIRDELGGADVPRADVQAYYERNRARYDSPERYQLWRILCKTHEEAQSVIDVVLKDGTPKTWMDLARDHSQDKATALRSGDLGFLTADGESTEPGLRVDPAIVRAAQVVRDGDIVRAPIAEGNYFAVVWRRGTQPAQTRSIDSATPQIRDILRGERSKEKVEKLIASLRAAKLSDLHEELLDGLQLDPPRGAR